MRLQNRCLPIVFLALSAILLDSCSFSVRFLPTSTPAEGLITPEAALPEVTSIGPTGIDTAVPPTPTLSAVSPTRVPIRLDTVAMLQEFARVGKGEIVHGVAFTPDGTVLASAGGNTEDFAIHVWDVASGREIGTLGGHNDIVWDLAFSPNGEMLTTVSSDGTAQVRDWRTGDVLKVLNFPSEVVSVSFSPDGGSLAVGGVDQPVNQVRNAAIWTFTVGSWEPQLKFPEYWNISAMAYSPRGGTLVGGGTSRNVQVWSTNDATPLFTLNHAHQVSKVVISPDGSTAATGTCTTVVNTECTDGGLWLWDLATGRLARKLAGFPNLVVSLAYSADGSLLFAGSRDGTVRVYATSDYEPRFEAVVPGGVSAMAVSADGGLLATGNHNGEVRLWTVASHR